MLPGSVSNLPNVSHAGCSDVQRVQLRNGLQKANRSSKIGESYVARLPKIAGKVRTIQYHSEK
jgi:hypothetical protein